MTAVICFEDVSKQYRLGEVGTGTISRDLERMLARLRGKEDPYAAVGEVNDRQVFGGEFVWALRDVTFDVQAGEVFGIIGRNGAGKSTLLKVLSRITAPTTGRIRARGRIASLLEVGTGFHPELTGRENVFLNGALLGMTRREIRNKMDEIVDFSGCAKFLDTPVKRYSSGMVVRLGFSVAAHLECEIMVVDEVLAVGDASFQERCLRRMSQLARDGRTVLFVSHNMQAVEQLCTRAGVIEQGKLAMTGSVADAVAQYFASFANERFDDGSFAGNAKMRRGYGTARISRISFQDEQGRARSEYEQGEKVHLSISITRREDIDDLRFFLKLSSGITGEEVTSIDHTLTTEQVRQALSSEITVEMDTANVRPGIYPLYFWLGDPENPSICYDCIDNATRPLLITKDGSTRGTGIFDVDASVVAIQRS